MWPLLFVAAVGVQSVAPDAVPCNIRYGNDSFVCVCNATYCDTIPEVNSFSPQLLYVFTSGRDGNRFNLTTVPITSSTTNDRNMVLVTPKPDETYQSIIGFGGAFTDSAVANIRSLGPAAEKNLLEAYFGPRGLRYTLGRVPLAATDFSARPYSYDDGHPGDYALKYFSLAPEDVDGKIDMIKKAQRLAGRKLNLVGGAWTAPAWMKVDNKTFSPGRIRTQAYDAFARYHIRFLLAYKLHGLSFWGITNGNEPVDAFVNTGWSPAEMEIWISRDLGPYLSRYFPRVKLLLLDDFPQTVPKYLPIMESSSSRRFISGWAIHPYTDIANLAPNLVLAHSRFPDKLILLTEFSVGITPNTPVVLGSWQRAEDYAIRLITGLNNWAVGWLDWNLALDSNGGPTFAGNNIDSAIIVNGSEFYKQPSFFAQGHFSHFITPGSRRIGVEVTPQPVGVNVTAAVTPDGKIVVVLLNTGEEDIQVGIGCSASSQAVIGLPAKSIVTAIYRTNHKSSLIGIIKGKVKSIVANGPKLWLTASGGIQIGG